MASDNVRINDLLEYLKNGKIMEAMKEFYADNVTMEEPAYEKTEGLPANLEREQKFLERAAVPASSKLTVLQIFLIFVPV